MVGLPGFEPGTSRLSGVRSNQLSYRPENAGKVRTAFLNQTMRHLNIQLLRKEVIQPHLPVRLPCYDFTLLTNHTFGLRTGLRVQLTRLV